MRATSLTVFLHLLCAASLSHRAQAVTLEHVIQTTDNQDSLQTGGVCGVLLRPGKRLICAAARHLDNPQGLLQLDILAHANDEAVTVVNRFLNQDFDQDFFDKLFREENFQHVSGAVSVIADYGNTEVRLVPAHVMGAFKVGNPSLPSLHVGAAFESVLSVSQNFFFARNLPAYDLLLTPEIFYYERRISEADTDLLSVADTKPKDIVKPKREHGTDGNLGVTLVSRSPFMPSFGLRVFNVGNPPEECLEADCDDVLIDVKPNFQTRATVSTYFTMAHPIGHSLLGAALPFAGAFKEAQMQKATATYVYQLLRMKVFAAYAPIVRSFGFSFAPESYEIGIQYTDEKQDNRLQIERERQTYVYANIRI